MSRPFRFAGEYLVPAPRDHVLAVLRDADRWPQWWPAVRSVERLDAHRGLVTIRSTLPITLRLELIGEVDDPASNCLRARLRGDLVGWIEFRVRETGPDACVVDYDQECVVARRGLRRLATPLRPVLALNHAAMMRSGMRAVGTCRPPSTSDRDTDPPREGR